MGGSRKKTKFLQLGFKVYKVNLEIIFSRMLIMTNPIIANKRRQIKCSHCRQIGHSSRSITQHSYGPSTEERAIINGFYI